MLALADEGLGCIRGFCRHRRRCGAGGGHRGSGGGYGEAHGGAELLGEAVGLFGQFGAVGFGRHKEGGGGVGTNGEKGRVVSEDEVAKVEFFGSGVGGGRRRSSKEGGEGGGGGGFFSSFVVPVLF